MGKIVFIDFDGTLAEQGVIPAPHIEAIREARRRGHRIVLCTGRPRSLVSDEIRALFDGMVGAAGGYVDLDGEVLSDHRFPAELGDRVRALLDANEVAYLLETPDAVHARPTAAKRIATLLRPEAGGDDTTGGPGLGVLSTVQVEDDLSDVSFSKVACFDSNVPLTEIVRQLRPEVGLVPSSMAALGERAGELYLAGVNKSVGMLVAARHFGADDADIVAIGDGYNDLEMLQEAATAVVIEGAPESLIELADLVVPPPARAGLVEAFERLGLTG